MFLKEIDFKEFNLKKKNLSLKKKLNKILNKKNSVIESLSKNYKNSYDKTLLNKYKKSLNFRVIGMGGSILGTQAIYDFLGNKIKKKFEFINNLDSSFKNKTEKKPDILFIDGGKGQLSRVNEIIKSLEISDLSVAAIAKGKDRKSGDETVYVNDSKNILKVSSHSPAFHYIQQIRDEAHRFAVTGHRIRRKINRKSSKLDGIEGLGPVKKRELLKQFGGIQGVLIASIDDLRKVRGISKDLAVRISNNLHK